MPTCPNGHQSGAEDWCEVCGHRMPEAGAPAPVVPPPPSSPPPGTGGYGFPAAGGDVTVQAELCPQCRTPREAQAPFCEECRYNFVTRTANPYAQPPQPVQGFQSAPPPPPQHAQPPQSFDYHGSRPSRVNRPAEPLVPHEQPQVFGEDDWVLPPPVPGQSAAPAPYSYEHQGERGPAEGAPRPVPPPGVPAQGGVWVAVITPDREYFLSMMNRSGPEASGLNLPAYSPELRFPLGGHQVTIGRRRHSTGESPDIDLSRPPEDPGVSHQHAMLVQQPDGGWAVVDQDSTNGTTVNGSEDPIQPYVPVPLQDGDRVHVGAWTTITVRRG
ncbi:FHA domain-containing protein [Streptomyces triculaminicus]|uniref:FHA domain-containing protein n=1 Tax=Streptomyces triculaminicus TaxID=2816232 RepID=UPI0037CDCB7B